MWGRSKKKNEEPECSGHLGDLNDEQHKCWIAFKDWIIATKITQNPWHSDSFLLKFCRAQAFDLEKAQKQFAEYMEYRKREGIDTILTDFENKHKKELAQYYPRGYCGADRIGRPIYIERCGNLNPTKFWETIDEATLYKMYYQDFEKVLKHIMMAQSVINNKQIQHSLFILDLKDLAISNLTKQVYGIIQMAGNISANYYPEQLGATVILNSPMVFRGCWSMIKGFLPPQTKATVTMVNNRVQEKLLELVDEEQLHVTLGGKNEAPIEDDLGPWSAYEVVDGHQPGDVVGVRKIGDPADQIFTPYKFEQLPNYLAKGEIVPIIQDTVAFDQGEEEKYDGENFTGQDFS